MDTKIQLQSNRISEIGKWTPGKFISSRVTSPLPLVSNAVKVVSNRPGLDFTLRDKTKLLKLADRIQTKKMLNGGFTPASPPPPQNDLRSLETRSSQCLVTPTKRSNDVIDEHKPIKTSSSASQNTGTSFRRSKLYSSFSPTKRTLNKLAKNDPTKTNIEHLVKRCDPVTPTPLMHDHLTPVTTITKANFHDSAKLSSAFSAQGPPSRVKLFHKSLIPQKIEIGNGIPSSGKFHILNSNNDEKNDKEILLDGNQKSTNGTVYGETEFEITLRKISSAQIIPLNISKISKGSKKFKETATPPPLNQSTTTTTTNGVELKKLEIIPSLSENLSVLSKESNDEINSHKIIQPHQNILVETLDLFSKTKKQLQEAIVVSPSSCQLEPGVVSHQPRQHRSLTTSVSQDSYLIGKKSTHGNQFEKNICHIFNRKRSHSLPNSFLSLHNELKNMILPLPSNGFWTREESGFVKFPKTEERRMTVANLISFPPPSPADPQVKVRSEKREGRPMSFDYGQRNWMRVYRDMELSQAIATATTPSSQLPPLPAKRLGKKVRNLSITHLHLIDSSDVPEDRNSVTPNNGNICETTNFTTPSLFQRFSKTFSLRFGSSHSPREKTSKKGRFPSGSSPDIFSGIVPSDSFTKCVDPSSGKIRKLRKSNRGDKCQSGDSGIQMGIDEDTTVIITNQLIKTSLDFDLIGSSQCQSSNIINSTSPISMKKLSLVEIPTHTWDSDSEERKEDDAGFLSCTEDDRKEGLIKNGMPNDYYNSLPFKFSRQKKELIIEKKKNSVRGNVIHEIITTEQNYVKNLNDIVQGFLNPCKARCDLFSEKIVSNIFSNIENILRLHLKVLESLKLKINENDYAQSSIGEVFLKWAEEFDLYSEYCYQNPMSMATVRQLTLNHEYAEFFEACRRLQLMDKLPLHGFLLRPIQRICQYHLQLNELLKHTPISHEDYKNVEASLVTMKAVAMRVNDTQRKFDSLQEIVRIQNSIDAWEGSDLVPGNSILLQRGDLVRTRQGRKQKEAHLILLNIEMIVCRKDSYRKGTLLLESRIPMCSTVWLNIDSNEEDECFGMVHNSWRVYDPHEKVWILFTAANPTEKKKWTKAFEKTSEEVSVDLKMSEMAKATALKLLFTENNSQSTANLHIFPSTSTLPRLRKNRKNSSLTKSDSDAMLMEVGKLRKSSHFPESQNNISDPSNNFYVNRHQPRPNSKFYV